MKHLILAVFLGCNLSLVAQDSLTYTGLLASTSEINLADSLNFDTNPEEVTALDSNTVKKWFSSVLPTTAANKFKNRAFSLIGKLTTSENFDLLVLLEKKRRSDSTGTQIIYLISTRKTGEFIASLKAAVGGTRKRTGYNISSCLYKDYRIIQDSKITVDNKAINDMVYYKINSGGRFVSYPKFE